MKYFATEVVTLCMQVSPTLQSMMSSYGDDEPEDAWDASDPRQEHIHNMVLRLLILDRMRDLDEDDPDVLDHLEARVHEHEQRTDLTQSDEVRIQSLLEDIALVRQQ